MSSPVTGSDFVVGSQNQSLCDRLTSLLGLTSKVKLWFDWAFTSSGGISNSFLSMTLPPPGVIFPYYVAGDPNIETVRSLVEKLNRDDGDGGIPFWRLCDGTNGTPDLRGRVIVGCGQNTGASLTNRPANQTGGAESFSLSAENLPAHGHAIEGRFVFAKGSNTDAENDFGSVVNLDINNQYVPVTPYSTNPSDYNYLYAKATGSATSTTISTMPPYQALFYIIRTSRVA